MKLLAVLIAIVLSLVLPFVAMAGESFATPKALLEHAYQPYSTGDFSEDPTGLYSQSLKAMLKSAQQNGNEDEVGPVDFDVFINAQDYQLSDLVIADPEITGDTATDSVTFKNFDKPQSLKFYLVKEDGSWRIDDIESLTGDDAWRLSVLLANSPTLN